LGHTHSPPNPESGRIDERRYNNLDAHRPALESRCARLRNSATSGVDWPMALNRSAINSAMTQRKTRLRRLMRRLPAKWALEPRG